VIERDKMLHGDLYDASDASLVASRDSARRLLQSFNALDPGDVDTRMALLRELLGSIGDAVHIEAPFYCDYGFNIHVGDRVFLNMSCVLLDAGRITLGDDVQLGPMVQLLTSDHPRDAGQRASGLECARPITIGARAWLGAGTVVLPGIEIGPDVTVGAGSVVTRSLPAGVTAVGNPCRVVGR
jgi:maltose O-acetyltransferase